MSDSISHLRLHRIAASQSSANLGETANNIDSPILEYNILLACDARFSKRIEEVAMRISCISILCLYVLVFNSGLTNDHKYRDSIIT